MVQSSSGIGGLHIVVAVAEDGGFAGGVQPIGVDQRMFVRLDELDVLHAGGAQGVGDEVGGAIDIGAVFGQGADAGNAQELLQLFEQAGLILLDEGVGGGGHGFSVGGETIIRRPSTCCTWECREQALYKMRRTSGS